MNQFFTFINNFSVQKFLQFLFLQIRKNENFQKITFFFVTLESVDLQECTIH